MGNDRISKTGTDLEIIRDHAPIADDSLEHIAARAEARIEAVTKIKQLSLKVTNASDWVDQNGKPYLQASGAEKIANLFSISWGFLDPEPLVETDPDGHYTVTFRGTFSMGTRTIEVEGSRSSRDPFFVQYKEEGGKRVEKTVPERDNRRDVKMAALTNLLGNGITRILGIRNLTYEDLQAFAGIKKEDLKRVEYKGKGTPKPPQASQGAHQGDAATPPQIQKIHANMGTLGYTKEEEKLSVLSSFLGRQITVITNLTKADAFRVIEYLQTAIKQQEEGKTK